VECYKKNVLVQYNMQRNYKSHVKNAAGNPTHSKLGGLAFPKELVEIRGPRKNLASFLDEVRHSTSNIIRNQKSAVITHSRAAQSHNKYMVPVRTIRTIINNLNPPRNLLPARFDSWRNAGAGVQGRAIIVNVLPAQVEDMRAMKRSLSDVLTGEPLPSQKSFLIVFKFSGVSKKYLWEHGSRNTKAKVSKLISGAQREAAMLLLARKNAQTKPALLNCRSVPVPNLYFAGYKPELASFVIAMSLAQGDTVLTVLKNRFLATKTWELNAEEFAAIEKAVLHLWSLGICHCDLHESNIMLDILRGKATIIDLGHAVAIPDRFRSLVRKRVLQVILLKQGHAGSAFDDLWFTDGIGAFAEAALLPQQNLNPITQEPIQEYNSDGDFLRKMYFYVRPTQLPNIPKARMKAWACGPRQK